MSTTTMGKSENHQAQDAQKIERSEKIKPDQDDPDLKRRLLIVEDEEQDRQQLQKLLEADTDLQVDGTNNGKQALEWLTEHNYSIVLTDLRMAGLDGMDLIRAIQQRGLPVTVIVMTGNTSIHEAVEAIRLGAYDFLLKPIDLDYLQLVIKRALRERRLLD
jgi:DNA-binding NtrC family response regulator